MSKLLVVVDMQNDFISGSLGSNEAKQIVEKVVSKINAYKLQGETVVYTRDTHQQNYLKTQEGTHLPVEHCIEGSWGWQLEDTIKETVSEEALLFDKNTFGSTALGEYVKEKYNQDADLEIELVGLCTDICVISNAMLIKAYVPEVTIKVDASCCAGVTPDSHLNALSAMKMCQIHIL